VGPGASELNAKREMIYQKKLTNNPSGDLLPPNHSANVSNAHSLPGNSKWEKIPTNAPKSFMGKDEILEE
jgi:hypothetical protein